MSKIPVTLRARARSRVLADQASPGALRASSIALASCLLAVALGGACGGNGNSSTGFTGTGAAGASGTVGTGGPVCGNGKVDEGEECDSSAKGGNGPLQGTTCVSLGQGFNGGTLKCSPSCKFDTSGCTKMVNCFDGTTTCMNPACADACSDPCGTAGVLAAPDPSMQSADTSTHPAKLGSKCTSNMGTGPNLVYEVKAANTGVLEVDLDSGQDLGVSVRTTCDQAGTELGCIDHFVGGTFTQRLVVPCTQGESLFIVVGGNSPTDQGDFMISIASRPIACGDGFADPGEECDDGNTTSGDGCSATCKLESTETEPNDSVAQANAYTSPWYGSVSPAGDVDVVSVSVGSAPSSISVTMNEIDVGACAAGEMESVLQILGPDGTTVLGADDTGLMGACAKVTATAAQTGTYYVRVAASPDSASSTFPYALDVQTAVSNCGDGVVQPGEQCDPPGPTCTAACKFIFSEHEPNNTTATANAFTGTAADPWFAQISPAGDFDFVSFTVPAGETSIFVYVDDNGDGDCHTDTIIAKAELIAPDGSTVLASNEGSGSNYCPTIMATPMGAASFPPGTYFVRVSAGTVDQSATFAYRLRITQNP